MAAREPSKVSARIAFAYPNFTLLQLSRFLIILAMEMQSVAVGWQVYEITKQPLALGYAGLAQFLPGILLFLVAGHAADRYDRRKLLIACDVGFASCFALLLFFALRGGHTVRPIYAVLVLLGIFRAFSGPVARAIFPQLVPQEHFQNAVAWSSSVFQAATILGPALGGVIYAVFRGPSAVYVFSLVLGGAATLAALQIKTQTKVRPPATFSPSVVFAGFRYIWSEKAILGSISLDLFAVFSRRSRRPASCLRQGDSQHRTLGAGTSAHRPCGRGGRHGHLSCPQPSPKTCRGNYVVVRGRLWNLHHSFWNFHQYRFLAGCAGVCRSHGHGERHCARHADSGGYAR